MNNFAMYVEGKFWIECLITDTQYNSLPQESLEHYKSIGAKKIPFDEAVKLIDQAHRLEYNKPWEEITEDKYNYFLNELPPENWNGDCFRMCEYWSANITAHYMKLNGKCYTALRPAINSWMPYKKELLKQLNPILKTEKSI